MKASYSHISHSPVTAFTCDPAYQPILFPKAKGELLAMPGKIVRPPSSNPAYPAIKVPEAINPGRAMSYTRQSRAPT